MRTRHCRGFAALLLLGLASTACSGKDDGGTPERTQGTIDTGVDPATTADQLTPAEAEQICLAVDAFAEQEITAHTDDFVRTSCVMLAWLSAPDVATCEQRTAECVAMAEPGPPESSPVECEPTTSFVECSATVGEIETCLTDSVRMGIAAITSLDCASLLSQGTQAPPVTPNPEPASCAPVRAKCPALVETSDGGASGAF